MLLHVVLCGGRFTAYENAALLGRTNLANVAVHVVRMSNDHHQTADV